MLFEKRFWSGIADGSVTVTFRRWKRVQARAGRLHRTPDLAIYRVRFHRFDGPDPRTELGASATLPPEDLAALDARLARLDGRRPWTRAVLEAIAARPEVPAADLAAALGRDRESFKLDVRKLKNLGLTLSLPRGYRLSQRGEAYLAARSETPHRP